MPATPKRSRKRSKRVPRVPTDLLPSYLIKSTPKHRNIEKIRAMLTDDSIHTVCESASCPNIGECFERNTLTFMILGDTCTRGCAFCGVKKGDPLPPDPDEPRKIREAAEKLGLDYVVVTSVTRDDLPDQGATQFRNVGTALAMPTGRQAAVREKRIRVEFLIPDFQGDMKALQTVLDAKPFVLNHNVETVPRLYKTIRPQADYGRSLALLKRAKELSPDIYTKSGFMVGLGENDEEVMSLLLELKSAGCDIVTIGQYLPPSKKHPRPERFVEPKIFDKYREEGERIGIFKVHSGPFVRSSYKAGEILCRKRKDY